MHFANTNLSYTLLLIALALLVGILRKNKRKSRFKSFSSEELLSKLNINYKDEQKRSTSYILFIVIVTLLLVFSALRPRWGFSWKESKRSGVDIVIAVDVSESMLAEDLAPNRLKRARREIIDLLNNLKGDRVSLVAFSGAAFVETPLTQDYKAFRLFLDTLTPELIPIKGTNIEEALLKSIEAFGIKEGINSKPKSRAIILITDGESFEGDMINIGKKASHLGIQIYIIGIGTTQGAPIPTRTGFKKDKTGAVIVTTLNKQALENLALLTGGIYVTSISSSKDTDAIYNSGIKRALEDQELKTRKTKRWNELFQAPLLLALVLLVFGPWIGVMSFLKKDKQLLLVLLIVFNQEVVFAETSNEELGAKAKELYHSSEFDNAEKEFEKGSTFFPEDFRLKMGHGASLYRQHKFKEASKVFLDAVGAVTNNNADKRTKKKESASALYNAANSMVQLGKYEEAIKLYEESLNRVADDKEVVENLEYAKKLLEKKEEKKNKNKQQQEQEQENEKEEQNKSEGKGKGENKGEKQQQQQKQEQQEKQENQNQQQQKDQQQQQQQQENQQQRERQDQEQQQKDEQQQKQQEKEQQEKDKEQNQEKKEQDSSSKASSGKEQEESQTPEEPLPSVEAQDLLEYIEENRGKLIEYRRKKSLEQLRRKRQVPDKDW